MNFRKSLVTAAAGLTFSLGVGQAMAVDCSTINTIGGWAVAGSLHPGRQDLDVHQFHKPCRHDASDILLGGPHSSTRCRSWASTAGLSPGNWGIKYDIAVADPTKFYISDMFAGADNPIATSLLSKAVTGDPGGNFVIGVINGNEGPGSEKHGLTASLLTVDESFSVGAGGILLSVSNTYLETEIRKVPTPGTLALLGLGLVALGVTRRRKFS